MRWVLIFWALPMGIFWGWYGLSYHDVNLGTLFLSRDVHDLIFGIYGHILGMRPEAIPVLVAKACIIDTLLIGAFLAWRRRKRIRAWLAEQGWLAQPSESNLNRSSTP